MWNRQKNLLLASAALFLVPAAAAAQEDGGFMLEEEAEKEPVKITTSTVEMGAGFVTDDSFKFGEYTGLEDSGTHFIGNVESYLRPPYDNEEGDTRYFELRGNALGLESRSLELETGKQGDFGIFFEYDAIPHFRFDDGETPFIGGGSSELALPPSWTQVADPADLSQAQIDPFLRGFDVKTERERIGAGFKVNLTPQWELSTSFRTEEKTGIETIAGIFGTNGGDMRSAILPKPIDFTTHDAGMTLGYSGERLQAQFGYNLSVFDNDKGSLTWENPFNQFQPVTNDGRGRLGLEPDNSAHHFSLAAGYMLAEQTRLTGSLSLGRMIQDDEFLPYTIRTDLAVPESLPRNSLDGEVNTIHATLGVATRPSENTDLRAEYKFDDRDNNTPVDAYLRVQNDSAPQLTAGDERFNRPYSRRSHTVETELGYDVTSDTKLSVGYDFETIDRDLQEVEDTYEHTGRIKARTRLTDTTTGRLEYAYSDRTGSTYETTRPFLVSHSPPANPDDAFEQNAFLRKYYMSDRQKHLVTGSLIAYPSDRFTAGLSGSYSLSNYPDTQIGLTDSYYASGTLDGTYMPSDRATFTGYFTFEQIQYDQTGNEVGANQVVGGGSLDPTTRWDERTRDNILTAGLEFGFSAIPDTLDLVFDYTYSLAVTDFEITAGSALSPEPLPDLETTLHSVGLRADYQATDAVTLRVGYRYEKFDVEDFALKGINESDIQRVFVLGNGEPNYDVHLVGVSAVMKF